MSEQITQWLRDEITALRAEVGNLREEVARLKTSTAIAGVLASAAVSGGVAVLVSVLT